MNIFKKKTKSIRVPLEEYEQYRDTLLSWEWMTEAFDSDKNAPVYKATELGIAAYSAIVTLIGKESLVNGYKLDIKKMSGIVMAGQQVQQKVIIKLLEANIITRTYSPENDKNSYELTPEGAKLFVAFFVSYNRVVGTLPGDKTAAFFKIMENMPKYVNTVSAMISQLGSAFQSFDQQGSGSKGNSQQDLDNYTPGYGKKSKPKWSKKQKQTYAKNKAKWKKENTYKSKSKKKSGSKKQYKQQQQYKEPENPFSKVGNDMMKDMGF